MYVYGCLYLIYDLRMFMTGYTVKPVFRGHFDERIPCDNRIISKNVSHLPHVKAHVMKGHLSCRDTFSVILRCPLKTGFTVCM